jgi:hypothetical protein
MHGDQWLYTELYYEILKFEGDSLHHELLRPWMRQNERERRWLDDIRARRGTPVPPMAMEERWRLYGLSRIIDLLQLSFAPRAQDAGWNIPAVTAAEFAELTDELGLERHDRRGFHPFFHEIVTVEQAPDESAAPELVDVLWPGFTIGPLLMSRAGVGVRAGRRHLRKEIAERSTLFWAHARNNRPTSDLSVGWGGNSQWRTSFRRDYALGGALHYNVDATPNPIVMDRDLDAGERLELLRHRCFVTSPKQSDDRWPYDQTLVEEDSPGTR